MNGWWKLGLSIVALAIILGFTAKEGYDRGWISGDSHAREELKPRIEALENAFKTAWQATCPDFQTVQGYGHVPPGQANLTLATNWIGQHFGCLAFTIEMPFKDNAALPDGAVGWNGDRSKKLGASVLLPLLAVL